MEIYNQITLKYLKGNSIYPEIRRIIAFLLKLSISTYAYVFFFGKFDVYLITEYQKIIYFFLSGQFFIPFIVFALTHITLTIISIFIFQLFTFYPIYKLKKKIIKYKLTHEDTEIGKDFIKSVAKYSTKKEVKQDDLLKLYNEYKHTPFFKDTTKTSEELEEELIELKKNVESNFYLTFLILISSIIFYNNLPDFYTSLFVIVIIVTVLFSIFSIAIYRFFDILPTIVLKIPEILNEYGVNEENKDLKDN